MNKLSIIIPVYYNAGSLEPLITSITKEAVPYLDDYEIIMVDDGSGDDSWEVMKKISNGDKHIKLMRLSRNFGSHAAVMAGFSVASGDCVVSKAADMQEPTQLLVDMYNKWKEDNKVVIAVRQERQEAASKRFFANMYYWLIRKLALPNMPKTGFDICLLDRQVLTVLQELNEKNSAITLQVLWTGFKTCMVEYVRLPRTIGKSKWTFRKKLKLVIDSLVSFSYVPIRFMAGIGGLFVIVALVWGVRIIISWAKGAIPIAGWTSIMMFLLFSVGLIMMTLGILGEYIWRTLDASRNRPLFIIDEYISEE